MFKKILVANRGEVALRVMRTYARMGVSSVADYSDADRGGLHALTGDEAVGIGESSPRHSYLLIELIVRAAVQTGARAIHPDYGFLSENADFAEHCERADL